MGAVCPAPEPGAPRRRVLARKRCANYLRDTLACGHVVLDYDNRHVMKRHCQQCKERVPKGRS